MSEIMLHELDRTFINSANVSTYYSEWSDNSLFLLVGKEIRVYEFTYNISQKQKNLDFRTFIIACPIGHPAAKRYNMKLFNYSRIDNQEYNEMLAELVYWPFFSIFSPDMSVFVSAKWSPSCFVQRNQNLLAGLTNMGILYVFVKRKFNWELFCDFYLALEEFYNITDLDIKNKEQMKEIGLKIGTTAFCWGPKCNTDTCIIITAQRNGDLIFWELNFVKEKEVLQPIVKLSFDQTEKSSLYCIEISNTVYLLLYSINNGQLHSHVINIEGHNIKIIKSITPWTQSDKIAISCIRHISINNYFVLAYVKHRHLILQVIDDFYNIKYQYTNNVNDYTITSLFSQNDQLYFTTQNCEAYVLNGTTDNNQLNVTINQCKLKETFSNHLLRGLSISKNQGLWTFILSNRCSIAGRNNTANELVFMTPNERHELELQKLIENPKKTLYSTWDIIEALRVKTIKFKALPFCIYEEFYKDSETDLYKLKAYLIVAFLHKSLKDLALLYKVIPVDDIGNIKETILAKHCYNVILSYSECELSMLEESEKECLVNCRTYLECYCRKYNLNVINFIPESLTNIRSNVEYICQSCDSKLVDLSCPDKHINPICSRTLTPLEESDYLSCMSCNSVAKLDEKNNMIQCVFCDLFMVKNN